MERIVSDSRFVAYYDLLTEWNQKINLTTIINREEVFLKHFYDSILPLNLILESGKLLDIGSGAGLPAIPIKLLRPSLDVTMIDSVGKKVAFLTEVINKLGLERIRALHLRIEDFMERDFDVVTSRAVAPLNVLLEYSLPFLKIGGIMIAYKGSNIDDELANSTNALKILGGEVKSVVHRKLTEDITRSFIIIEKVCNTPPKYPRGQNKPRISPL